MFAILIVSNMHGLTARVCSQKNSSFMSAAHTKCVALIREQQALMTATGNRVADNQTLRYLISASTGSIFSLDKCSEITVHRLLSTKYSDHAIASSSPTQSTASSGITHAI